MDYNEETGNQAVSKINAAGLINLLICDLWKEAYLHSRKGDLSKWNATLNCLWVEFGGDIKTDEKKGKASLKEFKDIEEELSKTGSLTKKKAEGFSTTDEKDIKNASKQYTLLMKKALFLKRLQNSQGKGTAYQSNVDDYMDF